MSSLLCVVCTYLVIVNRFGAKDLFKISVPPYLLISISYLLCA